jgi:hypothetical protein
MAMLGEAISAYTQYESSSVRTETAQGILQSLLYSIDFYLMKLSSLEQSMEALQKINIAQIYNQGLKLIKDDLKQALQLLQEVQNTKLAVSLIAYNDTINKALVSFLIALMLSLMLTMRQLLLIILCCLMILNGQVLIILNGIWSI